MGPQSGSLVGWRIEADGEDEWECEYTVGYVIREPYLTFVRQLLWLYV